MFAIPGGHVEYLIVCYTSDYGKHPYVIGFNQIDFLLCVHMCVLFDSCIWKGAVHVIILPV